MAQPRITAAEVVQLRLAVHERESMLDAIDAHIRTMLELPNLDANGFAFNLPNVVKKAEVSQTMVDLIVKHYDSLLETRTVDVRDFAARLQRWSFVGLEELGDTKAQFDPTAFPQLGIGITVGSVVSAPDYAQSPLKISSLAWESRGRCYAANGGGMRTAILGLPNFHDLESLLIPRPKPGLAPLSTLPTALPFLLLSTFLYQPSQSVAEQASLLCRSTHFDPRSVASSVSISLAIALLLQGEEDQKYIQLQVERIATRFLMDDDGEEEEEEERKEGDEEVKSSSGPQLTRFKGGSAAVAQFMSHILTPTLKALDLENAFDRGFAYKQLGACFWALRHGKGFAADLLPIVLQGGDADTNAAPAGALLGAKYGFNSIPSVWVSELWERDWLTCRCNRLLLAMGLRSFQEAEALVRGIEVK